ncbi:hypothetical protein BKA82DRAFT_10327 [Pisolithus tinctorius]|uniref:Uncharacterized protein n=1 Tax=Pisolithus tinctorius Marx 270 TaxID=870435 RepID=A0A0C3IS71_PISTI|nr:hypothetical protein BKA82DRAFT_10327 [Pisolithus tinctorius]KIN99752.1 hypothetical protein M404DRAFT_10327 [Pisolithus tinctorius Marx 270]
MSKYMLKEHPLLGLNEDGFKLEMLCINDYSGWHKNHFTPSSKLKGNKRKSDPAHSMNVHVKWPKELPAEEMQSLILKPSNADIGRPFAVLIKFHHTCLSCHNLNKENEFPLQNPLMNVFGLNGVTKKVPLAPSQSEMNMNMELLMSTTSVKGEKKMKM